MNRLIVMPYKMSSMSSRAVSRHFSVKRVYPGRNYVPRNGDVVINWGFRGEAPVLQRNDKDFHVLNPPESVEIASNKIKALTKMSNEGVKTLTFFTDRDSAKAYLEENNESLIYCRTIINGREGKGIVLSRTTEDLVDSPLYTAYFENDREFRVHVFNGEIIDFAEKKKMSKQRREEMGIEVTEDSKYIRNLKKAWSFCRKEVDLPEAVESESVKSLESLGLTFGAVDIAYNSNNNECAIFEINTAPGMKNGTTTHFNYVKAIGKLIGEEIDEEAYNQRYECTIGVEDIQE